MKQGLILIDIQNDYFGGGKLPLVGIDAAAANARSLLGSFREATEPVFHIQHISTQPGATFFLPDTEGAEIHASVAPEMNELVVKKHFPNSFKESDLFEHLQDAEVDELVICGAMTHMCIDSTTRAAFDFGFTCVVAKDACATRDLQYGDQIIPAAQVQAAFMAALSSPFAQVITTSEI